MHLYVSNFRGMFNVLYDMTYSAPNLVKYVAQNIKTKQFSSFNYGASWDDSVEDPCNYCGDNGAGKGLVHYFEPIESDEQPTDGIYSLIPKQVYEDIEDYIYVCMCGNCKSWWIHVK